MQNFVGLANRLADEAGLIINQFFRKLDEVDAKEDASPVTQADKLVEMRLREILAEERPEDAVVGEEFDNTTGSNEFTWVLDPIDGTKAFASGWATFGTLIALCEGEKPILGLIDQPVMKDRWVALVGERTIYNGGPCETRRCPSLKQARGSSTQPEMFSELDPNFLQVLKQQIAFMTWGKDCTAYGHLASGHVDVVLESGMKVHDFLALVPVVEGAGGIMADWYGKPLTLESGGTALAVGDPSLLQDVLGLLNN